MANENEEKRTKLGKVYKIVNDITDEIYVGSTKDEISKRMGSHRRACKNANPQRIYQCMREHGVEHFRIVLVEDFKHERNEQLRMREQYWIEQLGATLNGCRAYLSTDEKKEIALHRMQQYYESNKEYVKLYKQQHYQINKEKLSEKAKQYYENNKDNIAEKAHEYYHNNKEVIGDYNQQYYIDNKEKISHKVAEYRQANKEKISQRSKKQFICECGSIMCVGEKTRHKRSNKHQTWLAAQAQPVEQP